MLLSNKALELITSKYEDNHKDRLVHTLGVAEMAEYLAKRYGVDKEKALIAAYLHDYCKYDDTKNAKSILKEEEIQDCEIFPFLYHAYLSAEAYKELFKDNFDEDIYNAIKYHVFGRPNMSLLESIIMIADYTEKNRKYPSCVACRKILVDDDDLNMAIYKSLEWTLEFAMKEGHTPHPAQVLVMEEYKRKVEEDGIRSNNR